MATRLDRSSRIDVKLAEDGDSVIPGPALLAPGDIHLEVVRSRALYAVALKKRNHLFATGS